MVRRGHVVVMCFKRKLEKSLSSVFHLCKECRLRSQLVNKGRSVASGSSPVLHLCQTDQPPVTKNLLFGFSCFICRKVRDRVQLTADQELKDGKIVSCPLESGFWKVTTVAFS